MVATYETLDTTGMVWFSSGLGNPSTEVTSWIHNHLVTWLGEVCNPTLDSGSLVGGSGYTNGTYTDVSLVRASNRVNGKDLLATVEVTGGAVTSVTITQKGNGFKDGDLLEFENIAEVGGTGSGFNININTADASIAINRDPDDCTSTYGWFLGVERGLTNAVYGKALLWTSTGTFTAYNHHWYNWSDTTSNSGTGTWSTYSQTSASFWYNSTAGQTIHLCYESSADQQFFLISDTTYRQVHGCFKAVRHPSGTYLSETVASPWSTINGSSSPQWHGLNNASYATDYVGSGGLRSYATPANGQCLFRGQPVYGYGAIWGSVPTNIGIHANTGAEPGTTLTNGTETWVALSSSIYAKIAD